MSTPEGALLRLALDYLQARHVLAFRLNTGAIKMDKRFVRFGVVGMADIIAFPVIMFGDETLRTSFTRVVWLELKAPKGRQTEWQASFQAQVESHGHTYAIIRSLEDLEAMI